MEHWPEFLKKQIGKIGTILSQEYGETLNHFPDEFTHSVDACAEMVRFVLTGKGRGSVHLGDMGLINIPDLEQEIKFLRDENSYPQCQKVEANMRCVVKFLKRIKDLNNISHHLAIKEEKELALRAANISIAGSYLHLCRKFENVICDVNFHRDSKIEFSYEILANEEIDLKVSVFKHIRVKSTQLKLFFVVEGEPGETLTLYFMPNYRKFVFRINENYGGIIKRPTAESLFDILRAYIKTEGVINLDTFFKGFIKNILNLFCFFKPLKVMRDIYSYKILLQDLL